MSRLYWTRVAACTFVALIFVVLCAWPAHSAGMQDAGWLRAHASTHGNYYEGLLDQPNAKQEYEVLGFFAYGASDNSRDERPRLSPDPGSGSELQAWFYVPRRGSESDPEIRQWKPVVRAKQIASRTNYLLQSMPEGIQVEGTGWSHFSWRTDPFIGKYHINPNNLGVVARLDDPADMHLFPVVFSLTCKSERISHYELMLKIQRYSLADLSYEVAAQGSGSSSRQRAQEGPIEVGTVLELPFAVNSPDAGWRTLHISGRYKNSSDGIDVTYRFFHQPAFQCE